MTERSGRRAADGDRPRATSRAGNGDGDQPLRRDTGFSVLARAWLDQRRFKPTRTYAQYESRVEKHIIRPLGEMAVGEITPLSIAVWIDGLRDNGLSETTIYLVFSHLSGILDFAVEEDIIPRNPCRGRAVREAKPKKTRRPAAFVSVTGAQSNAIRSHLPERYRATVDLGRGLGLRQGEIFGFSPDDIDWKTKTIHIQRQIACDRGRMVLAPPKCSDVYGIRDRWIPAADEVLFRLIAHATEFPPVSVTLPWASRHGEPRTVLLMFATPDHQPINKSDFNPLWKSALEAAGIIRAINDEHRGGGRRWEECRDKIMHALRHLYASERLAEGMDVAILALRLGHIDPAYTLRSYAHQVTDDHQEERERIDKTLRGTRVPRSAPDVQL